MSTLLSSSGSRVFASPLARRLARENNMDLTLISGSGPEGRIIKRDIERVLANPATNFNTSSTETQVNKMCSAVSSCNWQALHRGDGTWLMFHSDWFNKLFL